jgi:competence protein ComEC
MHLAIVSTVIAFFLKKPLGLKGAAASGALFIFLYVYLVGPQASLLRAAIMYLAGALSVLLGLKGESLFFLSLSFLIQLVLFPQQAESLSFILSYLALGGILLCSDDFYQVLLFRGWLPKAAARGLAASLGAFTATAAVCAAVFGVLRPLGILTGLIIVPLSTLFMIFALVYLAAVLILPPLAVPLGQALSLVYRLLTGLVDLSALLPGLTVSSMLPPLVLSLLLWAGLKGLNHRLSRTRIAAFP